MSSTQPNVEKIKFEDRDVLPILSIVMIIGVVVTFSMQLAAGKTDGPSKWLTDYAFSYTHIQDMLAAKNFQGLLSMVGASTFGQLNWGYFLGSIYFLWALGCPVEQKMGIPRFLTLALLGIIVPWPVMYVLNMQTANFSGIYFGTIYLLATMMGSFVVIPPEGQKRFGDGGMFKPRNEIFRKDKLPDADAKFKSGPEKFVMMFVIYEVTMYIWTVFMATSSPLFPFAVRFLPESVVSLMFHPGDDKMHTLSVIPLIIAFATGYTMAQALLQAAAGSVIESPLMLEALKRYRELVNLDVNHEEALKGTASAMGLPVEKIRGWVQKGKGKMQVR